MREYLLSSLHKNQELNTDKKLNLMGGEIMRILIIIFFISIMFSLGKASPKDGNVSIFLRGDLGFLRMYPEESLLIPNQWNDNADFKLRNDGYSLGGWFGIEPVFHINNKLGIGIPIILHSFDSVLEEGKLNGAVVHEVIYKRINPFIGISFLIAQRLHLTTYVNKYSLYQEDNNQKNKFLSSTSQIWEFTYYHWIPKMKHAQPEPVLGLTMRIEESKSLTLFGFFIRINYPLHLFFPKIDLW